MKLLLSILFLNAWSVSGQPGTGAIKMVQYLLDSFTNGKVVLRSGGVSNQSLNYNIVTQEMIFKQDGKYLAIAYPAEVDTIYLAERKFVYVDNAFYEWLGGTVYPLFEEFNCTVKEPGTPTGFGESKVTASASLRSLLKEGGAYGLKLPDEFEVVPGHSYYIRKNGQYYKIKNEQQLVNLFPAKKKEIREWVKANKASFSKTADVVLLIQQIQ